jgi:hypothetical protein
MALTLVEAMKLAAAAGQTHRAGVIAMYARSSGILQATPFKDIEGNAYAYNREGALPSVAFRGVNESYTPSTGVVNPLVEALRIAGGDLDVDVFLVRTGGASVRGTHEGLKIKALAAEMTRVIFKGDSESNPREFDGLQKRIMGDQLIPAKDSGATDGGDPLSLSKLDEVLDAVPNATHLAMSKALRRRLTASARKTDVAGYITYDLNEFGQRVTSYNGVPILVNYEDNGGTDPLGFNEVGPGGSTATAASIYALALGDGMVTGIQNGTMSVRDLGELETAPVLRTRVEWFPGLCIEHGRAAARLYGISDAAVIA